MELLQVNHITGGDEGAVVTGGVDNKMNLAIVAMGCH
jgi:hypothetical protein